MLHTLLAILRIALAVLSGGTAFHTAFSNTPPDLAKFADSSVWRVHNRGASTAPDRERTLRLDARPNDGVPWLVGSDFSEGTIEVDLKAGYRVGIPGIVIG